MLGLLARRDGRVTCYLSIDSPLKSTPVVPADEIPRPVNGDVRLDIVHDAYQYDSVDDGRVLYLADYRVHLPWPGDVSEQADMHAVGEGGDVEEYAACDILVCRQESGC